MCDTLRLRTHFAPICTPLRAESPHLGCTMCVTLRSHETHPFACGVPVPWLILGAKRASPGIFTRIAPSRGAFRANLTRFGCNVRDRSGIKHFAPTGSLCIPTHPVHGCTVRDAATPLPLNAKASHTIRCGRQLAEDVGFEPTRGVNPARVPGV